MSGDASILLSSEECSSANYTKYLRPWNQVPSWEQCRKAINDAVEDASAAEVEVELLPPSSLGGFDWRIFVANHEWREELLGHGGITKAVARTHRRTRHHHLLFSCVDGSSFMLTRNTLRRFDSNGEQHIVKSSEKAVKVAFREALSGIRKSGKRGPCDKEEDDVVAQFNASLRDMMASFFRDVLIGVPLGSSNSSEWIKFVDNPEVIKVKEDARMVPQLVAEVISQLVVLAVCPRTLRGREECDQSFQELKSRWIAYVRENFKVIRMSSAQAAKLGQLKNDEIQEASRATGDSPAIAAKVCIFGSDHRN